MVAVMAPTIAHLRGNRRLSRSVVIRSLHGSVGRRHIARLRCALVIETCARCLHQLAPSSPSCKQIPSRVLPFARSLVRVAPLAGAFSGRRVLTWVMQDRQKPPCSGHGGFGPVSRTGWRWIG